MTSKEELKSSDALVKIDDFIWGSPITKEYREILSDCVVAIAKDLEDYEELKKIMGTPIQEIMKKLKVLKILKRVIFLTNNSYYIQTKKRLNEEDYKLIKEYLDGKD